VGLVVIAKERKKVTTTPAADNPTQSGIELLIGIEQKPMRAQYLK